MAVWLVRAGGQGEREAFALEHNVVVIGWGELLDLAPVSTREELLALCQQTYPNFKPRTLSNWVAQIWAFRSRIDVGDLVVLPLKTQSAIAVGRAVGPYQFHDDYPPDARHTRPVEWIRTDLPRGAFDQDILSSFGAFLTVCQIQRNNAEERIRAVLSGRRRVTHPQPTVVASGDEEIVSDDQAPLDLELFGRDQIRQYIGQKFHGHDLTRLVTEILRAQGYQTLMAPPGADGGVDIIAGQGPLGFDAPRLVVQVKSSDDPIAVGTLRELQGVLPRFGADQGLLVSWGGFRQTVMTESRQLYFKIRLWDAGVLVDMLLRHYDGLPEDLRAELPLKRIWTLVIEE